MRIVYDGLWLGKCLVCVSVWTMIRNGDKKRLRILKVKNNVNEWHLVCHTFSRSQLVLVEAALGHH